MGKTVKLSLLVLSVALNVSFVAVWVWHGLPARAGGSGFSVGTDAGCAGACALHRQLSVADSQWQKIEPHFVAFSQDCRRICQEVTVLRRELIDAIAAPNPDRELIRRKQDAILAAQRTIQKRVVEQLLREKEVLTLDQQRKLFDLLRQNGTCTGGAIDLGGTIPCGSEIPAGK